MRDDSRPNGPRPPHRRQLQHDRGLAARLGGWSTRHRRAAVFGWLLFAVLASVAEAVEAVEATGEVRRMRPPVPSKDGTAGLLNFQIKGEAETAGARPRGQCRFRKSESPCTVTQLSAHGRDRSGELLS